ncbi:MAG: D-aminoacyl-tRNA deacylase, partial [Planctomycetota bacterium]|nr:D-aminoacyl-tRNA deacylase [Planctomycetota bacterium]
MIAIIQRVTEASVQVSGEDRAMGSIGRGLCVLACVVRGDGPEQAEWMAGKIARLRIFPDEAGRFDRSVVDEGGSVLLVSQYTLAADCPRGNRPGFSAAA